MLPSRIIAIIHQDSWNRPVHKETNWINTHGLEGGDCADGKTQSLTVRLGIGQGRVALCA